MIIVLFQLTAWRRRGRLLSRTMLQSFVQYESHYPLYILLTRFRNFPSRLLPLGSYIEKALSREAREPSDHGHSNYYVQLSSVFTGSLLLGRKLSM